MREVGAWEAENNFSQLLDQVERGEEILITRHGRVVARLAAAEAGLDREKGRRAVTGILEASKDVTLGGLKIKDLVGEGRP